MIDSTLTDQISGELQDIAIILMRPMTNQEHVSLACRLSSLAGTYEALIKRYVIPDIAAEQLGEEEEDSPIFDG